jgi:hypothetical protein
MRVDDQRRRNARVSELLLGDLRRHPKVIEQTNGCGGTDATSHVPTCGLRCRFAARASTSSIPETAHPSDCRTRDHSAPSGTRRRDVSIEQLADAQSRGRDQLHHRAIRTFVGSHRPTLARARSAFRPRRLRWRIDHHVFASRMQTSADGVVVGRGVVRRHLNEMGTNGPVSPFPPGKVVRSAE